MYLLIVCILLFIAAYFDWKTIKIPNWIHILGIGTVIVLHIFGLNELSIKTTFINLLWVFIPLFSLWFISTLLHFKAIGAGDIKLFAVISLFLPLLDTYLLLLLTLVISSIIAVYKIRGGRFLEMFEDLGYFIFYGIPGKSDRKMTKVPLGPILFLTFLFYLTPYYDLFSAYWR
ncbi:prepilin peptidase [[Brevibacterium] frigoritolerans]|nr:prepilin peptidase [Peribacillus frigoritolerans]